MSTPKGLSRLVACYLVFAASLLLSSAWAQTPTLSPSPSQPLPQQQITAGPATRGTTAGNGGMSSTPANFDKLRILPGFLLHLAILGEPQLTQDVRVNEAGDVNVSLIGAVHVQDLTETQAREAIATAYVNAHMLKSPQVQLSIAQYISPRISVVGQVQVPGEYELIAPTDLLSVLTLAGGATPEAGNRITIHRAKDNDDVVVRFARGGDTSSLRKIIVSAGDSVVVNRAGIVYVLGAVNRPGGYVMSPDGSLNVIQAIALALDTNFFASIQKVRIIRKTQDGLIDIPVRYKYIVAGKESPQALEPDDIVYVPNSKLKVTLATGKQLAFQASGAAIYAGIQR